MLYKISPSSGETSELSIRSFAFLGGKSKGQNLLLEGDIHENVNDSVVAEAVFLSYQSSRLSVAKLMSVSWDLVVCSFRTLSVSAFNVRNSTYYHLVIIVKTAILYS